MLLMLLWCNKKLLEIPPQLGHISSPNILTHISSKLLSLLTVFKTIHKATQPHILLFIILHVSISYYIMYGGGKLCRTIFTQRNMALLSYAQCSWSFLKEFFLTVNFVSNNERNLKKIYFFENCRKKYLNSFLFLFKEK